MLPLIGILMKPLYILVYAGACLALRMTRKIDSFRTGEVFCLIMPEQTSVASAVNEYKLHFTLTLTLSLKGEGIIFFPRGVSPLFKSPGTPNYITFLTTLVNE